MLLYESYMNFTRTGEIFTYRLDVYDVKLLKRCVFHSVSSKDIISRVF